jgi:hypothetical protein
MMMEIIESAGSKTKPCMVMVTSYSGKGLIPKESLLMEKCSVVSHQVKPLRQSNGTSILSRVESIKRDKRSCLRY